MMNDGVQSTAISIHALREEGDYTGKGVFTIIEVISIHALREEGDVEPDGIVTVHVKFLSTPSARRAT